MADSSKAVPDQDSDYPLRRELSQSVTPDFRVAASEGLGVVMVTPSVGRHWLIIA